MHFKKVIGTCRYNSHLYVTEESCETAQKSLLPFKMQLYLVLIPNILSVTVAHANLKPMDTNILDLYQEA